MTEVKYTHRNRHWTPAHVRTLQRLWKLGYTIEAISDRLFPGCTPGAIRHKAYHLCLQPRECDVQSRWTPAIEAVLVDRWKAGISAARIALEIKTAFEIEFTRSSIIGKAHRLKLPAHKLGNLEKQGAGHANRKINARLRKAAQKPQGAPLTAFPVLPLPTPSQEPDRALWVNLEDLKGCAWVYGDPLRDHGYCGCETVPGKSYCLEHFRRIYIQLDVRRPKKQWDNETKEKIKELQRIIAE
jgi:GcrA cell cycle regulator